MGTIPRHIGCAGWPLGQAIGVSILNLVWPIYMPHPEPVLFGLTSIASAEAARDSESNWIQKEIFYRQSIAVLSTRKQQCAEMKQWNVKEIYQSVASFRSFAAGMLSTSLLIWNARLLSMRLSVIYGHELLEHCYLCRFDFVPVQHIAYVNK